VTLLIPLAFLASLLAANHWDFPWWSTGLPAGAGAATLCLARRPWQVIAGLAALAIALGGLRWHAGLPAEPSNPFTRLVAAESIVAARGVVVDQPVPRDRAQLVRLRVDTVRLEHGGWHVVSGLAQVTARPVPALHYGDVLELRGALHAPEAGSPPGYAAYLRRQGVSATIAFPVVISLGRDPGSPALRHLFALRERLASTIDTYLPEPHTSLAAGILLGRRTTMSPDLRAQLNRSGTSHLVAVSGFNVSLVIGFVLAVVGAPMTGPAWRRWGTALLASFALWAFVALVGPSGSVVRAAAMAQLGLVGRATGRSGTAGAMLLWGCAFLASWDPTLLRDVGWQLSFLGTAGLIWLSPLLSRGMPLLPGLIREALATTLAAQVFVFPILVTTFGNVSVVAPVTNVLVLPLVPAIMLGTFALVVVGPWLPPVASLAASLTWIPTGALLQIVTWSAALPWAAADFPTFGATAASIYLAALVALCWWIEARGLALGTSSTPLPAVPKSPLLPRLAFGSVLVLFCVAVAMAAPIHTDAATPEYTISVPAVVEGTLLLAQAPDGRRILVNGGPGTGSATALLGDYLRPWDRTVDVVVTADPREGYLMGLGRVLERYRIGLLVDAVDEYPTAAYRQLRDTAKRHAVRRLVAEMGSQIEIGSDFSLEILDGSAAPTSSGDGTPARAPSAGRAAPAPLALRLRWGNFSLLVPGDAAPAQLRQLLAGSHDLHSTVILLSARAMRDPNTPALLRAARPELVIVQGELRATGATPPAPLAPLPVATGEPEPTWHFTTTDGPLRLRVGQFGYRR
jgi:competence protein ComEC